jgi:hypothetical protein
MDSRNRAPPGSGAVSYFPLKPCGNCHQTVMDSYRLATYIRISLYSDVLPVMQHDRDSGMHDARIARALSRGEVVIFLFKG